MPMVVVRGDLGFGVVRVHGVRVHGVCLRVRQERGVQQHRRGALLHLLMRGRGEGRMVQAFLTHRILPWLMEGHRWIIQPVVERLPHP